MRLSLCLSGLRLAALALVLPTVASSQPANDARANAELIAAPGTVTGTTVDATLEAGEPVPSCQTSHGASVWWTYTPPDDGRLALDLAGSDFDTILTVFPAGSADELACNDDVEFPTVTSRLADVPVQAGQAVEIRVSGFDGTMGVAQGAVTLALDFSDVALVTTTLPPGDTSGGPTLMRPRTLGTGASGSCELSASATAVPYVPIVFTVGESGAYTLTIDDSATPGYDSYLLLTRGLFDPADPCLGLLALNDDGTPAPDDAQIAGLPLDADETYTLVVTGFANDDVGAFTGDAVGPGALTFVPVAAEPDAERSGVTLSVGPNPLRGTGRVRLTVDRPQTLDVALVDLAGRRVAELYRETAAGALELAVETSGLAAGVYVVRVVGTDVELRQRVTVVR